MNDEKNSISEEAFLFKKVMLRRCIQHAKKTQLSRHRFKQRYCPTSANDMLDSLKVYAKDKAACREEDKYPENDCGTLKGMVGVYKGGHNICW